MTDTLRKRLEDISSTVDPADTEDILAALKSHPVDIYTLLHNKEYLESQGIQFEYEQVADLIKREYTPEDVFEANTLISEKYADGDERLEREFLCTLTYAVLTYTHEEGRPYHSVIENMQVEELSHELELLDVYTHEKPDFTVE